jgi:hypothetical protein
MDDHQTDKIKKATRIHNDQVKTKKQVDIAKFRGADHYSEVVKQPHRLHKKHAMDCGQPGCYWCSNPRRTSKDPLTVQEKRMFQIDINDTESD